MKTGQIYSYKLAGDARYEPQNMVVITKLVGNSVVFKTVANHFDTGILRDLRKPDFKEYFEKYF